MFIEHMTLAANSGANTIKKKAEDSVKDFTSLQILRILSCTASDGDSISAQHAALICTPFGAFKLLWDFPQTFLFISTVKQKEHSQQNLLPV